MADLAGRLNIELKRRDSGVEASIRSSRPVVASRVFVGRTVGETTTGLPALFSVCATAQACASVSACEAAKGLVPSADAVRLRRSLVNAETVKEHLWRMLLDWPRFLGGPPRAKAMRAVMGAYAGLRAALVFGDDPFRLGAEGVSPDLSAATEHLDLLERASAEHIFGASLADWLDSVQIPDDLVQWAGAVGTPPADLVCEVQARGWAGAGRNPVPALPPLSVSDLESLLAGPEADRFVAEPCWRGGPRETSPFSRRMGHPLVAAQSQGFGNGLLPRLAAQLLELASLQQGLRTRLASFDGLAQSLADGADNGVGIARVQAARGLLVHRVAVDRDRICDYRVLAPTEWNFHPGGVVARGLSALPFSDAVTLERLASLFVTAVDPCVEYHVAVS